MRRTTIYLAGLVLALLVILATGLATPTGTVSGAGAQQTPTGQVDPGRTPTAGTATAAPTRTPTPVPTATPRRGTLTVAPSSGPVGAPFTVSGVGFSASALLAVAVEDANGITAAYVQPGVGADGNFTVSIDSASFAPGQYTVTVLSLPDANALAQATFTVAGMPGLPNTGEGNAASRAAWPQLLSAGAAIAALFGLAGVALRRRAA